MFHLDTTENPGALIKDIQENRMKVGIAIKPELQLSNCPEKQHCLNCGTICSQYSCFPVKRRSRKKRHWAPCGFIDQENVSNLLLSKHFLIG